MYQFLVYILLFELFNLVKLTCLRNKRRGKCLTNNEKRGKPKKRLHVSCPPGYLLSAFRADARSQAGPDLMVCPSEKDEKKLTPSKMDFLS